MGLKWENEREDRKEREKKKSSMNEKEGKEMSCTLPVKEKKECEACT